MSDQTATPAATRTSATTTLTMALAAGECWDGGLCPPSRRALPGRLLGLALGGPGAASGGGYGFVELSRW